MDVVVDVAIKAVFSVNIVNTVGLNQLHICHHFVVRVFLTMAASLCHAARVVLTAAAVTSHE